MDHLRAGERGCLETSDLPSARPLVDYLWSHHDILGDFRTFQKGLTMKSRLHVTSNRLGAIGLMAAALVGSVLLPSVASAAPLSYTAIALHAPWVTASFDGGNGVPSATLDAKGIVHLSGAAHGGGDNTLLGTLAPMYRPTVNVYLPMATDTGDTDELLIAPNGAMTVFGAPIAYASLANLSYATGSSTATQLPQTLKHNWHFALTIYNTGHPSATKLTNGIVRLSGSLSGGMSDTTAFVLPDGDRPSQTTVVPVDTFSETNGFIQIRPNGAVRPIGTAVTGFVSLAGVTFVAATTTLAMHKLTPSFPFTSSVSPRAGIDSNGIVHMTGVLGNPTNSDGVLFVLPQAERPAHAIYLPTTGGVEGFDAMVVVLPSGVVTTHGPNATSQTYIDSLTFPAGR